MSSSYTPECLRLSLPITVLMAHQRLSGPWEGQLEEDLRLSVCLKKHQDTRGTAMHSRNSKALKEQHGTRNTHLITATIKALTDHQVGLMTMMMMAVIVFRWSRGPPGSQHRKTPRMGKRASMTRGSHPVTLQQPGGSRGTPPGPATTSKAPRGP